MTVDEYAARAVRDKSVRDAAPELLASCKELRDALAAAMRVIVEHGDETAADTFVDELTKLGIAPGVGARAEDVIAQAEGRPRPHVVDTEPIELGDPST